MKEEIKKAKRCAEHLNFVKGGLIKSIILTSNEELNKQIIKTEQLSIDIDDFYNKNKCSIDFKAPFIDSMPKFTKCNK